MTTPRDSKPADSESPETNLTAGGDLTIGEYVGRDKITTHIGTLLQNIQAVIPLPAPMLIGAAVIVALGFVGAAFVLIIPSMLSQGTVEPPPTLNSLPPTVTTLVLATSAVTPLPTIPPTPTPASTPAPILPADHPELPCVSQDNVRVVVYEAASQTLWSASESGLLRVEHANNQWNWECVPLLDSFVVEALAASPGGVWVGGPSGVIALDTDGRPQKMYTADDGLFVNAVTALVVAENGWVWAGHYNVLAAGVSRFDPGTQTWQALPDNREPPSFNRAYGLATRSAGERVWVATGNGLHSVTREGQWTVYQTEDSPPPPASWLPDNAVSTLLRTDDGCLWVGTGRGTVIRGDDDLCPVEAGSWLPVPPPGPGVGWDAPSAIQADERGAVWLASQNGIWSVTLTADGPRSRSELARGKDLPAEVIFALAIDEGGEQPWLWIGTDSGLYYWPLP